MSTLKDITGERFNHLVAVEYIRNDKNNKAMWLFLCDCDNTKVIRASDVKSGKVIACGCHQGGKGNRYNLKEVPGYLGLHYRVKSAKGKASAYNCVDCGEQAGEWSYDKQADVEYASAVMSHGKSVVMTYSLDLDRYQPRCSKCHKTYDSKF